MKLPHGIQVSSGRIKPLGATTLRAFDVVVTGERRILSRNALSIVTISVIRALFHSEPNFPFRVLHSVTRSSTQCCPTGEENTFRRKCVVANVVVLLAVNSKFISILVSQRSFLSAVLCVSDLIISSTDHVSQLFGSSLVATSAFTCHLLISSKNGGESVRAHLRYTKRLT